jgi:hypothetical protein
MRMYVGSRRLAGEPLSARNGLANLSSKITHVTINLLLVSETFSQRRQRRSLCSHLHMGVPLLVGNVHFRHTC